MLPSCQFILPFIAVYLSSPQQKEALSNMKALASVLVSMNAQTAFVGAARFAAAPVSSPPARPLAVATVCSAVSDRQFAIRVRQESCLARSLLGFWFLFLFAFD
eukprot:795545_1